MLQANPSLTPPMVKAILQYTAQPLDKANLLQQGAGLLNTQGAVDLAGVLRKDIAQPFERSSLPAGANLLAPDATMPVRRSDLPAPLTMWSLGLMLGGAVMFGAAVGFTFGSTQGTLLTLATTERTHSDAWLWQLFETMVPASSPTSEWPTAFVSISIVSGNG